MDQPDLKIPIASSQDIANVLRVVKDVAIPRPLPNLTILIHGVNDVGEAYQAQDEGICRGLNARLNRSESLAKRDGDLLAADYNMSFAKKLDDLERSGDSKTAQKLRSDPDSILYRRAAVKGTWSPVIPFYWGFREAEGADPNSGKPYIDKTQWHGQWLDRYGNRLDKDGSKGGGPFVNATSNLADFWSGGKGSKSAKVLDTINRGRFSPIKASPDRRYFVLAALRLASLIEMIRKKPKIQYAAVNVMGHSQGCLIALLAQALLKDQGGQPADCLILQHPPYALDETFVEGLRTERGDEQETTQARLQTLINIVGFVTGKPQSSPAFNDALKAKYMKEGTAGKHWKPAAGAQRCIKDAGVSFAERDNRGKVYLYFSPYDKTVALPNVHGIGWQGVPDSIQTITGYDLVTDYSMVSSFPLGMYALPPPVPKWTSLDAMKVLKTKRFYQRVFTRATDEEDAAPEPVGERTGYNYVMRAKGVASPTQGIRGRIREGESRFINGEALNPPCIPNLGNEVLAVGYIDASIGLTSGRLDQQRGTLQETIADPRHSAAWSVPPFDPVKQQIQQTYDREAAATGYPAENRKEVTRVSLGARPGLLYVLRRETPNEMKARIEKTMKDENSFHSGIPANPKHHEEVSAYDLALGEPVAVAMEINGWLPYLRAVADWRTEWQKMRNSLDINPNPEHQRLLDHLDKEPSADAKALIDATDRYRSTGILPSQAAELRTVSLLISQTTAERDNNVAPRSFQAPA